MYDGQGEAAGRIKGQDNWPRDRWGRLECSPDHPMPPEGPTWGRWLHTGGMYVGRVKDAIQFRCSDCGREWTEAARGETERMSEPCCPHCEEQYKELLERRENRIATLERELRDVLEWATTERLPLRPQEIASIRKALEGIR